MDLSFIVGGGRFNLRVSAVVLHEGRVLAMRDERSPYYYLPGGRIKLGETAEDAVLRELFEELSIKAEIVRPLYVVQSFFTEDVSGERFHEICVYFLVDASKTELFARGDSFTVNERHHTLRFDWLDVNALENEYFYPIFLKTRLASLPDSLEFLTELE